MSQGNAALTYNALTLNGAQLSTDGTLGSTSNNLGFGSDSLVPTQKAINTVIKEHNFLPKSQVVIQGSVDSNGQANFLSASTDGVALAATATNVLIAYANGQDVYGQKNYIEQISADVAKTDTWGTLPAGTSYLYKELDITTPTAPVASYGSSLEKPEDVTVENQAKHILMHFEDSTVILDDYGHTITKGSGITRSSTQTKIGTYSANSDAVTANDWITTDIQPGAPVFQMETWFYLSATGVGHTIFDTSSIYSFSIGISSGNKVKWSLGTGGGSWDIKNGESGSTSVTGSAWHHLMFNYDGATYKVFYDGTLELSTANTNLLFNKVAAGTSAAVIRLCNVFNNSGPALNGYIDEFRYTPYPRQITTFTPYTTAQTKDASIYNITLRKFVYTAANKIRCYLGEAVSNGSTVSSVINYALNGEYKSNDLTLTANTKVSSSHNIGMNSLDVDAEAVCKGNEAGFTVGDKIKINSSTFSQMPAYNRLVMFTDIDEALTYMDSTAHAIATLNVDNWRLIHSAKRKW